jgi:cytochrome P450
METFILAMTLYPEVQRKAQAEIDRVVGNSRLPDYSDQDELPYVDAVLKEVLRWHPVTPLGMSLVSMRPQRQLNKIVQVFRTGSRRAMSMKAITFLQVR